MNNLLTTQPKDMHSDANALEFVMRRFLDRHGFITVGQVVSFNKEKNQVNIMPMLHAFTGSGSKVDGEVIYGIPVSRIQRGNSAIIMDPVPGDIGMMFICDRDISTIKETKKPALPGTNRMHSFSDAIYLGSILGEEPTQSIEFSDNIKITAPNGIEINGLKIHGDGKLQLVTGVVVDTHVHGGVESGGATTSPPE